MTDTRLDRIACYGTNAERLAFTPDPPAGVLVVFYEKDTGDVFLWDTDAGPAAWVAWPGGSATLADGDYGDITVGSSGTALTIDNNAVTTSKILNANVTLAKIANAAASSKLLGSGASGSGAAYTELTLGTNLSMSGTTLNAAATETLISSTTTTSSATSVNFTSIAGTYKNLIVRITGRVSTAGVDTDVILVQLNGDTGNNYGYGRTGGFGTTIFGATNTAQAAGQIGGLAAATSQSGYPGFLEFTIPQYAATTWKKVALGLGMSVGSGAPIQQMSSFYWNNTAAVTAVLVKPTSTNTFVDGTVVELIGVNY